MLDFIVFLVFASCWIPFIVKAIKSATREKVQEGLFSWLAFAIISGIILGFILWILRLWTEGLWFSNLSYGSVFKTLISTKIWLFAIGTAVFFVFYWINYQIVKAMAPGIPEDWKPKTNRYGNCLVDWRSKPAEALKSCVPLIGLGLGMLFGLWAESNWNEILLFLNRGEFLVTEPVLGKNVSYYVFALPVLRFLAEWLLVMTVVIAGTTAIAWSIFSERTGDVHGKEEKRIYGLRGLRYTSVFVILFFIFLIWRIGLAIPGLLFSQRGAVLGAGYTDVHSMLPMLRTYLPVLTVVAVFFLVSIFRKSWKWSVWTAGSWGLLSLILLAIVPAWVQHFDVTPNELKTEKPYIERNIEFTKRAYGLDKIEEFDFNVSTELSQSELNENSLTLNNVRFWDWRALHDTYKQMQALRLYYDFTDVDIDRYHLNGEYRQVMLSPRELVKEQLTEKAQTFINLRMRYTHGYGLCLSKVNEYTKEGMPKYVVRNMPPVSSAPEIRVSQPSIYYGEATLDHVFVKTSEPEFHYPSGESNIDTVYTGSGGVPLGSGLRKLAYALRFDGIRILLSSHLIKESRIMFHREILKRASTIAPFLHFDSDPYMFVADDGELWFVLDAYTVTANYPYSEPCDHDHLGKFNYIRNSVKIFISAFHGTAHFYVFDEDDPIIQAYMRIFPDLFRNASEARPDFIRHIRYPEDLQTVQGLIYSTYHMGDPQVFYNREDLWQIATETYISNVQTMIPYYVIIKLPGEDKEEFLQMLPFTPTKKDNMIAWMAGRCDGDNYGKLLVYKFSKQELVYGPMQIEARIDQDEEISEAMTLWGQMGSQVIRGNLLVIPIANTLLYVEPIYLQAENSKYPELKKIVVVFGDELRWADTFEEALNSLFRDRRIAVSLEKEIGLTGESITPENVLSLAGQYYRDYLDLMGQGKVKEAGEVMEKLGQLLESNLEASPE